MMVILGSCSAFVAIVLLAAAAWTYFTGKDKPQTERNQAVTIGLAGLGILCGLASTAIVVLYIVRFMQFSP